jgi:hypothetical protein
MKTMLIANRIHEEVVQVPGLGKRMPWRGLGLKRLLRMGRDFALWLIATTALSAWCATHVVSNTNDTGSGSLREAILSANLSTNIPDIIHFNIPGPGPHTLSPLTPLPSLTDPVLIDGYSQSGASPNTLTNSDNAVLQILLLESLVIDTTNSTVRGLALPAIQVGATPGLNGSNAVEGCFIGLDTTGTNSLGSPGFGILVQTPNNRIGGPQPAARNIISGKGAVGIEIFETFGTNNVVLGNFIGTDRTGTKSIGNVDRAVAVNMNASGNFIGGIAAGAGNVISGNLDRGITLDGSFNSVQGNLIGTTVTGQPLGNARTGVEIGGAFNSVGSGIVGNVIAYNGIDGGGTYNTNGVDVKPGATFFSIQNNSIFENKGLGIDVKADNLITPGFPVLTLVSNTPTATLVEGMFMPNAGFYLELFTDSTVDPSGHGEGRTRLFSGAAATDAGGVFKLSFPSQVAPGLFVSATANLNTEFSEARMVTAALGANSWSSEGNGQWRDGANWSLQGPPFVGHSLVLITNAGSKTVSTETTTPGFETTLTISNLVLSAPAGATNTLRLAQGSSTPLRVLRSLDIQSGGALVLKDSALAFEGPNPIGIDGRLTLDGGWLTATNHNVQLLVGRHGPGALTVSNGLLLVPYPIVGADDGADGTWHVAGGTNLVTTTFDIADHLNATGTVVVTGGLLSAPDTYVGLFGNGRLLVSNGVFQCAGVAVIGSQASAQGNFIAAGGTSTFDGMMIGVDPLATGTVLVTGHAQVNVNGPLDNHGTITVAGGNLDVLGLFDSGNSNSALRVTGGQFTATNDNSHVSSVTISNGTFLARDVFLGNSQMGTLTVAGTATVALPGSFNGLTVGGNGGTGIVHQAGGEMLLANTDINVGGLFSPAFGTINMTDGTIRAGRMFVGGQGGGNGTVKMDGGLLVASNLQVNGTSQFVLNGGRLQTWSSEFTVPLVVGDGLQSASYELLGGTNVFGDGLSVASHAQLAGIGTILGSVTNSGAIVPGAPVGRLNIKGDLLLGATSELRLDLGGYVPGTQFDHIEVSDSVRLGGKLTVSFSRDFQTVLTNGASFTVLTAGTPLTGAFANVASSGSLTTTDGYARFTVLYAGSTSLQLTGVVIVDTDGDGLPDWWEDQFGFNKNNPGDAALDSDGDSATNIDEYRAGTVPNDARSVFRLVGFQREASDLRLFWTTVGGKSYRVQTNSPSTAGSLTDQFSDFSPVISVGGVGESMTNFVAAYGQSNAPARYYRVRLVP